MRFFLKLANKGTASDEVTMSQTASDPGNRLRLLVLTYRRMSIVLHTAVELLS